jgi:alpha-beta hydrolase superfamily lysophospholipase
LAEPAPKYTVESFTASDGYRWHYRRYPVSPQAETSPRAHLVFVHGIQSHAGWYEYSCAKLNQAGFDVYFLDRRGSGVNHQDRGDAPSYRRLLEDVAEFLRWLTANAAVDRLATPVFLLGISWGGKLAAAMQRLEPALCDGLVLLCPGFFPRVRPSLPQRLAIAWSRLTAPDRLFPIPLNDPELFTASPKWQQFIHDDPLSLRRASARLLVSSVWLDSYLRSVPRFVTVPVLLLLAERDRIIDNAKTRRYVEGFATADRQTIEYPGASHTLEFEPDPDRFITDVQDWLNRHCPKAQSLVDGVS